MKTVYTIASIIESGHDAENAPAVLALCQRLDCTPDSVILERHDHYDLPVYSAPGGEYAVGTDSEADDATSEEIKNSIWAFNASFILSACKLPDELEEGVKAAQEKQCESANDWLLPLVERLCGLPAFVEMAVSADGRGHFLSSYDEEENEELVEMPEGDSIRYYIYRTN